MQTKNDDVFWELLYTHNFNVEILIPSALISPL
jgi:hypothetical protein